MKFIFVILLLIGISGSFLVDDLAQFLKTKELIDADLTQLFAIFSLLLTIAGIAGLIYLNKQKDAKRVKDVSSLVAPTDLSQSREIDEKVQKIFRQLDRVKSYRRRIWSVWNFTPFIRIRRYVVPTEEMIIYISEFERRIFEYIAQHRDEEGCIPVLQDSF